MWFESWWTLAVNATNYGVNTAHACVCSRLTMLDIGMVPRAVRVKRPERLLSKDSDLSKSFDAHCSSRLTGVSELETPGQTDIGLLRNLDSASNMRHFEGVGSWHPFHLVLVLPPCPSR
jgi:hypothetical protein